MTNMPFDEQQLEDYLNTKKETILYTVNILKFLGYDFHIDQLAGLRVDVEFYRKHSHELVIGNEQYYHGTIDPVADKLSFNFLMDECIGTGIDYSHCNVANNKERFNEIKTMSKKLQEIT